jgi:hypothetical protein
LAVEAAAGEPRLEAFQRVFLARLLGPSIEGAHVLAGRSTRTAGAVRPSAICRRALRFGTEGLDAIYHRSLIERCLSNESASRRVRARLPEINRYYLDAPPSAWRIRR